MYLKGRGILTKGDDNNMKKIDTLIPDIYTLMVEKEHKINEDNLSIFLGHMETAIRDYLENKQEVNKFNPDEFYLRMSKLGTGKRKLWFEANHVFAKKVDKDGKELMADPNVVGPTVMRFLQGHLTEALLLFLARESGHTVEYEQEEVEIDGVLGHIDAVIDGHLVDAKTASDYSYKSKFKDSGLLYGNDPYGYVTQLSCYFKALGKKIKKKLTKPSYFWAYNKSNSDMLLMPVPEDRMVDGEERVKEVKEALAQPNPPQELCFPLEHHGKSGNIKIHKECGWCPFKHRCFEDSNGGKGLRSFNYSNGVVHLTKVVNEPKVEEITKGEE
jgi:hypothetical protein